MVLIPGFLWWTLSYSVYRGDHQVRLQHTPALALSSLTDSSGKPLDLPAELGRHRATLLIFFRGYW